jgi:hypothetical protein
MIQQNVHTLIEKWEPLMEMGPPIVDQHRRAVTAQLLENQDRALMESTATSATNTMSGFDPILMSMIRRAVPNMIAYDVCGVQPMTMPTGVIFAMRARYVGNEAVINQTPGTPGTQPVQGNEALYNESNTGFGGDATVAHTGDNPYGTSAYTTGSAMPTGTGETSAFAAMGLSIEKVTVTAKTRQLRATASLELRQDLMSVHGLDADQELTAILSNELLSETNREIIRTIYTVAKQGASNTTTAGTWNALTDSDGRWFGERAKGLMYQIQKEANAIGFDTRRGKGNFIITTADVASALGLAGILVWAPGLADEVDFKTVDVTGPTYVGNVLGLKVYVDPYVTGSGVTVGYKGANPMDAGLFYAPYVAAQLYPATDPTTFAPVLGIKSRYAIATNPFVNASGVPTVGTNYYYRKFTVTGL